MSAVELHGSRILVTGGTGFIGQLLCWRLCDLGAQVTVLTRNPKKARRRFDTGAITAVDFSGLQQCERFDGVVNLAGATVLSRWSDRRRKTLLDSRVSLTRTLKEHLSVIGAPKVLVSGSAIGFYGDTEESLATERTPVGDGFAAQLCERWESEACEFSQMGTRVCLLRTGIVLDYGGGALGSMLPAFKMGLGGPIAGGEQWMSWIHREDLVSMIVWLLGRGDMAGPVNAVAPHPVRNREFTRQLAAVLRRPAFFNVPKWVLTMLLGQAAQELLLSSNRVSPQVALEHGFVYHHQALSDALKVSV